MNYRLFRKEAHSHFCIVKSFALWIHLGPIGHFVSVPLLENDGNQFSVSICAWLVKTLLEGAGRESCCPWWLVLMLHSAKSDHILNTIDLEINFILALMKFGNNLQICYHNMKVLSV